MTALFTALLAFTAPLRDRLRSEHGIEAIEYALIAALLSAIVVVVIALLDTPMNTIFNAIAQRLNTAAGTVTN